MKKLTYDRVKIGLFVLALALLFVSSILHKPQAFSEEENRYLAEMPALNTKTLLDGSFMKDYETYIVDHFPNRSFFTGIKTLAERVRGRKDDREVYFGKEGYLFGKYDTSLFESDMAARNLATLLKFSKEKLALGKEHFQVVLVPSSSEILKEKLPTFAPVYDQTALINHVKEAVGEEFVLDMPALLREKKDDYIFYRTDHHWTSLGAFYTYQALMERMGISPAELSSFKKEEVSAPFYGTYDSKVNTEISGGVLPDYLTLYSTKNEENVLMTLDGKNEKVYQGIFMREYLEKKDKYSVFMGGNHSITDIKTEVSSGRSLLILKDSFAHSLVPFLLGDFDRIVMVDLRHFNKSLKAYIKENEFTDILVLYSTADFVTDNNIPKLLR